ncbi:MAG: choice-of-anchor D domain-containing protein [Acidobacteriia bacterium]|nr:choice-of-anchor D domain-containing protein [Terriglobia bacterium]
MASQSGLVPQLVITPGTVNFANVVVGQRNTQTLQIANAGKTTITISQIQVSNASFTVSAPALPASLAAGAALNITVAFAPQTPGGVSATLTISSADLPSPETVPLQGSAQQASAHLQLSPSSLNFGNEVVQNSTLQNVTLSNTGNIDVTVSGISVTGTGFGYAGLTPGLKLAPQQQITFQVTFQPPVVGTLKGTLTLASSSISPSLSMALTGAGITASATSHSVKLSWNASASTVNGYYVYRGGSLNGPFTRLTASLLAGLSYTDSTVVSGNSYTYYVTAVNGAGQESAPSNATSAIIPNP